VDRGKDNTLILGFNLTEILNSLNLLPILLKEHLIGFQLNMPDGKEVASNIVINLFLTFKVSHFRQSIWLSKSTSKSFNEILDQLKGGHEFSQIRFSRM